MTKHTRLLSIICLILLAAGSLAQAQQNRQGRPGGARQGGGARVGESGFVVVLNNNDKDGSGTLSAEEAAGVRLLSPSLFAAVDTDNDGQITRKEAVRADKIDKGNGNHATLQFEGKEWISTHAIGAEVVQYKGKEALHLVGREQCLIYLPIDDSTNGTIEVDLAGPIFTGVVFRVRDDGKRAEKLYFRPQNAGTEKHENSVQYAVIGREDGHWSALRKAFPGKYEAGADIQKGEWFHAKFVIKDKRLDVYVNDGKKPVLTVDPMLDGISTGSVGLWGWDSYFANFTYTKE